MKNWERFPYAAIAFVVIAFIWTYPDIVSAYRQKRELEKTFQEYSRAIESRDYRGAYTFGSKPFKEAISLEGFAARQVSFESQLGRLQSIHEGGFYMHGRGSPLKWIGIVEEDRSYDRGKVRFVNEFHFEDGRWQLFGAKQIDGATSETTK